MLQVAHFAPSARRLAAFAACLALGFAALAHAEDDIDPPGRVARVNLTLGAVSLQPAGSEAWVGDVLNRPLTSGDKLWVDREGRAELHVGSSAIRLGSETGVGLERVDDASVHLRLNAGTLQLSVHALGPNETFEVATPVAAIALVEPGEYRFFVSESGDQLKVAVLHGQVAVSADDEPTAVRDGEYGEFFGGSERGSAIGPLPTRDGFDDWVAERERREEHAVATRYVSREVIGYEDLDQYGSWRVVDEYGPLWVPEVADGWAPYRYGHWAFIAPWGWTWIDAAPWGFAPFHYGRWVNYGGRWCWAPGPRHHAPVYAPALVGWVGGSGWSAGVAIGGGPPVGWFPLGWNEVYVPSYRVSNHYVRNVNVTNIHVTNEYINNYVIQNGPAGRKSTGDRGLDRHAGRPQFANERVAGAVTVTTRTAFTSAQPIAQHLTHVSREALERASVGSAPPTVAPGERSVGHVVAAPPRAAPDLWRRPLVSHGGPASDQLVREHTDGRPPAGDGTAARRPVGIRGPAPTQPADAPANPRPAQDGRPPATRPATQNPARELRPDWRPPANRDVAQPASGTGQAPPRANRPAVDGRAPRTASPIGPENPSPTSTVPPTRETRPPTAWRPPSATAPEAPREARDARPPAEGRPLPAALPPPTEPPREVRAPREWNAPRGRDSAPPPTAASPPRDNRPAQQEWRAPPPAPAPAPPPHENRPPQEWRPAPAREAPPPTREFHPPAPPPPPPAAPHPAAPAPAPAVHPADADAHPHPPRPDPQRDR